MMEFMQASWPWYISGPLIGLMVPLLLLLANKQFGISSSLRHMCAACAPGGIDFFKYNWKNEIWNLFFVAGILLGGYLAALVSEIHLIDITGDTQKQLAALGIESFSSYIPTDIFSWQNLLTWEGFTMIILGGFLVGFGARYAGGCTSGHAIMGMSYLQLPSLIAVIGFFIGGLLSTHVLLPFILN